MTTVMFLTQHFSSRNNKLLTVDGPGVRIKSLQQLRTESQRRISQIDAC
jgi:hypothetical protein